MADLHDDVDVTTPRPALRSQDGVIDPRALAAVSRAIDDEDAAALRAIITDAHEADVGALIEALEPHQRAHFIGLLGDDFDFTALTEIDESVRDAILDQLPARLVAQGVRELDSDDAVALLEGLPKDEQTEILDQLPPVERYALARSLDYPEESAGRRMQDEFIALSSTFTVGQVVDALRERDDLPERFYELYVVDAQQRIQGAVALDHLLRAKRDVLIADLADRDLRMIRAYDDQETVAHLFQRYNMVSAPVVDADNRLVGVITFDDVADVIQEEADEDIKVLGGVSGEEKLSDTAMSITPGRFTWLFANLLTALLASWVIGQFQESIEKMVSLAVLMPIVASMGGNAGTQTMTVAVRALATRELSRANVWRVIRREMLVGFLNGVAFAVIMGMVAVAWFHVNDLGVVIGLAMVCVLTAAALGGILIPLGLIRLGVDPAVSSGPFVTTVTDVVGFFSFLSIATVWFGLR